ncbi:MAG: YgiQ family radical SAM protein, partial [Clostridia bacterium]
MAFLPITMDECDGQLDFVMISGDAYVDHPSFGHAVVSRLFQAEGFKVGIIPQPQNENDYKRLGEPKYAFLVSTGVVDSMVNNYTASKKKRSNDEYSPGNKGFMRPDRALIVYSKTLKRLFPNTAIIAGGVEGSLRRFAHYDYWLDGVMPSVVYDSGCDLLIYGAGERPIVEICDRIKKGYQVKDISDVRGTCFLTTLDNMPKKIRASMLGENDDYRQIDSFATVSEDKKRFAKTFRIQTLNLDAFSGKGLIQEQKDKKFLVQNPPSYPLSVEEMDKFADLPYERQYHPSYEKDGGVKSLEEVKFSITSHRGCYGDCSFCAIT